MADLCKKHGVEINLWYSPSTIPQPKFVVDGIELDADKLYNEEEFSYLSAFSFTRRKSKSSRLLK